MEVFMPRLFDCVIGFTLLSTALPCCSQQTAAAQFAVFGAYSYLDCQRTAERPHVEI
jgi:hypothetical protein